MHRTAAALLISIVLLPASALAQDRGSAADQEACTPDVFRLCSDYIPDEGPILACLQAKRAQLSSACAPVIFPHAAPAAAIVRHHGRHAGRRRHASQT